LKEPAAGDDAPVVVGLTGEVAGALWRTTKDAAPTRSRRRTATDR
jgi:hypothetical protein